MKARQPASRQDLGQRGTASTEALIILPFFFIVWGGLFFAQHLNTKKEVVNEVARSCAWQRMTLGCTGALPPRCNFTVGPQLSNNDLEGSRASLLNYGDRLSSFMLDFQTMFGAYFRPTFGADRTTRISKPRQIGGGDMGLRTSFSEMCNELPGDETVPTVSSDSFCAITGWCN